MNETLKDDAQHAEYMDGLNKWENEKLDENTKKFETGKSGSKSASQATLAAGYLSLLLQQVFSLLSR